MPHRIGHLLRQRLLTGEPTIGLDRSPQMGRIARRRLGKVRIESPLLRAEAQAMPFAAESFAAILSTFPTEYILDLRTLDESRRVLRPGGRLIVVIGVRITPNNLPDRLLQLLYRFTGESPPPSATWRLPTGIEGFQLTLESIEAPGASVSRLTAATLTVQSRMSLGNGGIVTEPRAADGDLALVIGQDGKRFILRLSADAELQTHRGV